MTDADTERFRRVFDAHYTQVHAYARRRINPADVDDVVAETFTAAWRRLDNIPAGHELPWLYGVTRRVLANRRRGAARFVRLQARLAEQPLPSGHVESTGDDAVRAVLGRLPATDQEVLRLAAWEQLDPSEIAVVLGSSVNAATLRLSRARKRFRLLMTETASPRTQTTTEASDA